MSRRPDTRVPFAVNLHLSMPLRRLATSVAVAMLLTSSFDVFLALEIGGTFRLCQLLAPLLVLLAFVKASYVRYIPVLGLLPLTIWLAFQVLFIPATDFWPRSLGYCIWLVLNLFVIFAFVQLFGGEARSIAAILRWYLYSFALVASFGVLQFLLPLGGLPGILVQQWWIPGEVARVNGFSYEPSYYATYLMIGFVFANSLRKQRSSLLSRRSLITICVLCAASVVLSSSRIGILFLFLDMILYAIGPWFAFFRNAFARRQSSFRLRRLVPSLLLFLTAVALGSATASLIANRPSVALVLLNGTGLSDTAAHSVLQRETAFEDTVSVFLEHPLLGRSLGGVASAIAELEGDRIRSFKDSKDFEGMNVFAEALAASGVIGFVPFLCFLVTIFRKPLAAAKAAPPIYGGVILGLLRSLAFLFMMLQFNQNILRPYVWLHIALLATVYVTARRETQLASAANYGIIASAST